ncbi:MAG: hypothetical protein E6517_10910 [Intestinibacter bartlettii]|nr:hypothetical protein [Intestinibacter bartlettii]
MYKGKAIRKYILSKLLKANTNEKFCFLFFLKRLLIFLMIVLFNLYKPLITKHIANVSIIACGIEDKTIRRPLLKSKWIAKPNAIPVIILVETIFKKYRNGIGIKEKINI